MIQSKLIIAAIVLSIVASTSYLSYRFYGQIKTLETEIATLNTDLLKSINNTELVKQSCVISESISAEASKVETDMVQKSAELLEQLSELPIEESPPTRILSTRIPSEGVSNEQTSNVHVAVPADVQLQRLLDNAYCTAATSDPYCTTR